MKKGFNFVSQNLSDILQKTPVMEINMDQLFKNVFKNLEK